MWALWAALLVCIPVTSFPLISHLAHAESVSPLSLTPLVVLVPLCLVQMLVAGSRSTRLVTPLIVFAAVALISSAAAPFLGIEPLKGMTPLGREARALVTLLIGLGFYFVSTRMPTTEDRLRASLRWISIGGALTLFWATIQTAALVRSYNPPALWLVNAHRVFSIRDPLRDRVVGLSYEPSWLADQLVILYLPIWVASVLRRYTTFSATRTAMSVELALSLWGVSILFLTFSRVGYLALLAEFGVLGLAAAVRAAARGWERLGRSWAQAGRRLPRLRPWLIEALAGAAVTLVLLICLIGLVVAAAQFDPRIASLFRTNYGVVFSQEKFPPLLVLADRLQYAERVIYWINAYRAFAMHPFLGVGLGNAGFLLPSTVPAFAYRLPEIIDVVKSGVSPVANVKSLWFRLLAETGVAGFVVFLTWLLGLAVASGRLTRRRSVILAVSGIAGVLALVGMVFEGFSLDTFALPQLWVIGGVVTAAVQAAKPGPEGNPDRAKVG
jgi:hypothetical protein